MVSMYPVIPVIAFNGAKRPKSLREQSGELIEDARIFMDKDTFIERDRKTIEYVLDNLARANGILVDVHRSIFKLDNSVMPAVKKLFEYAENVPQPSYGIQVFHENNEYNDNISVDKNRYGWNDKEQRLRITLYGKGYENRLCLTKSGKIYNSASGEMSDHDFLTYKNVPIIQERLQDLANRLDKPELVKNCTKIMTAKEWMAKKEAEWQEIMRNEKKEG